MDRFTQLAAFVRTLERGSQAAAAREIGVTPAMVGRYIAALEDRLGTRLLHRTTARQSPTEAGAALHARATRILEQIEAAEAETADAEAEPRGTLRLSAPVVFGARFLAAEVARFARIHARLRIEMELNDRQVDLVEEGYDLAIRIARLPDSALVARRLAPCRTLLVAAPAYLAAHGTPQTPAALRDHECLAYAHAAAPTWLLRGPGGETERVVVRGSFRCNNGEALLAAAIAGAGIVLQPTFIARGALLRGEVVPVLPGWTLPELGVHAVFASTRHLPTKVRRFVDHLAGAFGGIPPWEGPA